MFREQAAKMAFIRKSPLPGYGFNRFGMVFAQLRSGLLQAVAERKICEMDVHP